MPGKADKRVRNLGRAPRRRERGRSASGVKRTSSNTIKVAEMEAEDRKKRKAQKAAKTASLIFAKDNPIWTVREPMPARGVESSREYKPPTATAADDAATLKTAKDTATREWWRGRKVLRLLDAREEAAQQKIATLQKKRGERRELRRGSQLPMRDRGRFDGRPDDVGPVLGGSGKKRYIKSPKGTRLLRHGPRGGKYYIYNGKKVYLSKKCK